jgi:hypothetical protein
MFEFFVFSSAFLIEIIGSYVSIIGLSALFSTNPTIIALAISLDIAKIVTVSFLYRHWKKINWFMKTYLLGAAVVLMVITSSGAAGYLSAEFQKAIIPSKESEILVSSMIEEKQKLEARKVEIDRQISQLPPNAVTGRQRLTAQFANELQHINARIVQIDTELPKLKIKQVDINAHAGPILYVAQAFNVSVEEAVKYVILLIIFVFDPLAIALMVAGNFLLEQKRESKKKNKKEIPADEPEVTMEPVIQHVDTTIAEVEEAPEVQPVIAETPPENTPIDPLPELPVISDNSDESPVEESKKRRGRKKKEESEPKPAITTEEQLEKVVHDEELADIELPEIPLIIQKSLELEPEELTLPSELANVDHSTADVTFIKHSGEEIDEWKPAKKIHNLYRK